MAPPRNKAGVQRFCQTERIHQIVMSFSTPVVGLGLQNGGGGTGAPKDSPRVGLLKARLS